MNENVLSKRIRERMRALNIPSARKLAAVAGINNVTISKVLDNNRPQVTIGVVARIATALQCSVDYLLGIVDEPTGTGIIMPVGGEDLLRILPDLPLGRRAELLNIADSMAAYEEQRTGMRLNELEQLAQVVGDALPPAQAREVMDALFRATRSRDSAGFDAILVRYGLASEPPHEEPKGAQ